MIKNIEGDRLTETLKFGFIRPLMEASSSLIRAGKAMKQINAGSAMEAQIKSTIDFCYVISKEL